MTTVHLHPNLPTSSHSVQGSHSRCLLNPVLFILLGKPPVSVIAQTLFCTSRAVLLLLPYPSSPSALPSRTINQTFTPDSADLYRRLKLIEKSLERLPSKGAYREDPYVSRTSLGWWLLSTVLFSLTENDTTCFQNVGQASSSLARIGSAVDLSCRCF